jgi:hypothetical protein
MKSFAYKIDTKKTRYGFMYRATIFKIVQNKPIQVGVYSYSSGSYRGHNHEVVNVLVGCGELPRRALTTWEAGSPIGSGYIDNSWKEKNYELFEL